MNIDASSANKQKIAAKRALRQQQARDRLKEIEILLNQDEIDRLPHYAVLALLRWHEQERTRFETWGARETASISELIAILKAGQHAERTVADEEAIFKAVKDWIKNNAHESLFNILVCLATHTRRNTVSDQMQQTSLRKAIRGSKKDRILIGWRWLAYKIGLADRGVLHSKHTASHLLAKEFNKNQTYIYNAYLVGIESDRNVFPDGIEAAKRDLLRKYEESLFTTTTEELRLAS